MNVLVVDDDINILTIISDILTETGHKPVSATNGEEALKIIESNGDFDLLIVDEVLLEKYDFNISNDISFESETLSGFEVMTKARDMIPQIKTIIISGFDADHYAEMSKDKGADLFLAKPFTMEEFTQAVNKLA